MSFYFFFVLFSETLCGGCLFVGNHSENGHTYICYYGAKLYIHACMIAMIGVWTGKLPTGQFRQSNISIISCHRAKSSKTIKLRPR